MGDVEAWTHEEGLRFACARDFLTEMMGVRSAMIAEEMQKANPDLDNVAKFRVESLAFAQRRNSFHVNDKEEIENIFNEFSEVAREAYFSSSPSPVAGMGVVCDAESFSNKTRP